MIISGLKRKHYYKLGQRTPHLMEVLFLCAKASHQDTHLCGILFDVPASSSRGIKSSLLDRSTRQSRARSEMRMARRQKQIFQIESTRKTMKDRVSPCIYYVCKGADCKKGFVKVDLKRCKNCPKYQPRKSAEKRESVREKRQKDKDRHDNWKGY